MVVVRLLFTCVCFACVWSAVYARLPQLCVCDQLGVLAMQKIQQPLSLVLRLRKTRSHLLLDKISEEFYIAILTLNSAIDIKF